MADTLAKVLTIESGYPVRQARKARGSTLEQLVQKTWLTGSAIGDVEQHTRPHRLT